MLQVVEPWAAGMFWPMVQTTPVLSLQARSTTEPVGAFMACHWTVWFVAEVGSEAAVGFHGHENLDLGCANTVMAVRAGATQIDGSVRRFGAGAGNTPLEAFVGVCDKLSWRTGVDFMKILDASEDVVRPAMPEECRLDRMTMMMGYAGVYSSFLKHAGNAAERYGVSGSRILQMAGERKLIGGQEDQLIDIALKLRAKQDADA